MGGGTLALGGGGLGVVGAIVYVIFALVAGGGAGTYGGLDGIQVGPSADAGTSAAASLDCSTGADANERQDCRIVGDINSVQAYWKGWFRSHGRSYEPATTVFFTGSTPTGCGTATTDVGPFYCPVDKHVYIDLGFFQELRDNFGAQGGPFAEAYVLAHEYGHHVQDLLGDLGSGSSQQGAEGRSVRTELQADCYAGVWANHASTTPSDSGKPLLIDITQDDVAAALDTASRIGDDYIQQNLGGGQVDRSKFTHGTSAQRKKWFTTGFQTGDPARCDTFGTNNLG